VGRAFGVVLVGCLFAATPGRAQVPAPLPAAPPIAQPVTGFVSSYEITRIARSAGFDPLAPPLREGTIYVLRATDYRGILMRVVIDARTGAIRDANRIVPGPGRYGQFYSAPSLYDPADLAEPVMVPSTAEMEPPLRPLAPHGATRSALPEIPPLPRPRPAALASRKPLDDGNAAAKVRAIIDPKSVPAPGAATEAKPQINSAVVTTAPPASAAPAAPGAPKKSPAIVEPLND
jgi:hypothetical protein